MHKYCTLIYILILFHTFKNFSIKKKKKRYSNGYSNVYKIYIYNR